jgi:pimeloyl-ACP methyl ester carboxylesterase
VKKPRLIGLIVLGLVVILGVVAYHVIPRMLANTFLYPNRQPLVKNPGDYGLAYEDVTITTDDGVALACWLMKGTGDDVIIIGHPATFTRYGYSLESEGIAKSGYHRDVEFVPAAKHLVEAGYSVLMYDQRNHGESGASPGDGPHDPVEAYRDLIAAVKFVADHPDLAGKDIGLLSCCQSSVVSMIAMSKKPGFLQEAGVKALVAVQPISIEIFYKQYGLPDWLVTKIKGVYSNKGLDIKDQDPVLYAPAIFVPTLFVQNVNDPWSDMEHSRAIYDAIPTEKEAIWLDEEEHHRFLAYNWFNDHPERLLDFLGQYLGER